MEKSFTSKQSIKNVNLNKRIPILKKSPVKKQMDIFKLGTDFQLEGKPYLKNDENPFDLFFLQKETLKHNSLEDQELKKNYYTRRKKTKSFCTRDAYFKQYYEKELDEGDISFLRNTL